MYSENLDLGQEVFIIRGTFTKGKKRFSGFRHVAHDIAAICCDKPGSDISSRRSGL